MSQRAIDQLTQDPRLQEARRLIRQAIEQSRQSLTDVRPPEPDRQATYQQTIERFEQLRAGALFYPYLGSGAGNGALVELDDGSVKYDMISGIGVHGLGHGDPDLVDAAIDAAVRDTIMQGNLQQNVESPELAEQLLNLATQTGAPLAHCFLTSSGAMANENALKLAFQKHHPADRLFAFDHCFMGRTLATAQVTDRPAYRQGLPETVKVDYIPFYDADRPEQSTREAMQRLDQHLQRHPDRHAAMCLELIQGEGGFYPGDRAFFQRIIDRLREHNIAVLIDEVQTFGRTTQPFAFQHFGLDQDVDLVTVGKLTQVCATLFTGAYKPAPGTISQTFTAATSAIFAASVILDRLQRDNLFGDDGWNTRLHQCFVANLRAIEGRHPGAINGPFGIGGMVAFTLFQGQRDITRRFLRALFDQGVIAFATGSDPTRVRMLPPIAALNESTVDSVCHIIEQTVAQFAESPAPS